LDQTDLKDNVDAILGGGGGTFWKLPGRGPPAWLSRIGVVLASPT
jgi:hypothetical protein